MEVQRLLMIMTGKDERARIPAANQSYQALSKTMKCMYTHTHTYIYIYIYIYIYKLTKLKIYTTLIKPIVLYSCEPWEMTEKSFLIT